jgi:DNA replication factor GINS
MEGKEISITYETLFELLRREKNRDELQNLNATFYHDLVEYLATKNQLMQKKMSEIEDASGLESRRILIQMDNTSKIIRELYERREKKIILLALNKARTGSSLIDASTLLDEEKKLFMDLQDVLQNSRQGILCNLLNAKLPDICPKPVQTEEEAKDETKDETRMVRFILSVPKFVGSELETYGPFETDDVARLPSEIASILINKGRAEEINE